MDSTYISDKDYAKAICLKEKSALSKIQTEFADKIMYLSTKFVNSRTFDDGGYTYSHKSGYTVNVNDDVSNTYIWLSQQLIKLSCKYEGRNKARLNTYFQACLNSKEILTVIDENKNNEIVGSLNPSKVIKVIFGK